MKDDQRNTDIGKIIRASMELTDEPSVELNNKIKAALYQQEAVMRMLQELYRFGICR